MSGRVWGIVVAVALLLFGAAYVGSPYFAYQNLREAMRSGDREALDEAIDFRAVRENMKSELNAAIMAKLQSDNHLRNNPLAGLGMLFAPLIMDRIVDTFLTPDALGVMIRKARAPKPGGSGGDNDRIDAREPTDLKTSYGFVSLDRFKVTLTDPKRPDDPLAFILERRGLFQWKLVRIALPPHIFDEH